MTGTSDPGAIAVVDGVDGRETNTFWKRLDDLSQPGRVTIRRRGEEVFGPGDVVARLPGTIHCVRNEREAGTVSLHVCCYNLNFTSRSEVDPEQHRKRPVVLKLVRDR